MLRRSSSSASLTHMDQAAFPTRMCKGGWRLPLLKECSNNTIRAGGLESPLLHHRVVQPEVKNSRHCLMFVIWVTEMVFSPQDQSQCWIRIGREEKHRESIPENPQMGKHRKGEEEWTLIPPRVRDVVNRQNKHIPVRDGCFSDPGPLKEGQKGGVHALRLYLGQPQPHTAKRLKTWVPSGLCARNVSTRWAPSSEGILKTWNQEPGAQESAASEIWYRTWHQTQGYRLESTGDATHHLDRGHLVWEDPIWVILCHPHKSSLPLEKCCCRLSCYEPLAIWGAHNLSNGRRNFFWGLKFQTIFQAAGKTKTKPKPTNLRQVTLFLLTCEKQGKWIWLVGR